MSNNSPKSFSSLCPLYLLNLIAFIYIALIIFSFSPWTDYLDEIKTLIAYIGGPLLLCFYLYYAMRGELKFLSRKPLLFIVGYMLVLFISFLMAELHLRWAGKIELIKNISYLGGFFIFFGLIKKRDDIFRAFFIWTLLAFASVLFGLFHYLGGFELLKSPDPDVSSSLSSLIYTLSYSKGQMIGPFMGQPRFAAYLLMMIPIVIGFMILERKRISRIFAGLTLVILLICFILTRPINLYCSDYHGRSILWQSAWKMFLNGTKGSIGYDADIFKYNPRSMMIGCGPGSYQILSPRYRSPDYYKYNIGHVSASSQNRYLDLLAETGILGFVFYTGLLFIFFISGLKVFFKLKQKDKKIAIMCILSGIAAVCVADIFTPSTRWNSFAPVFIAMLGMGFGVFEIIHKETSSPIPASAKSIHFFIICVMAAILLKYIGGYGINNFIGAYYTQKGFDEFGKGDSNMLMKQDFRAKLNYLSAISYFKQALLFSPNQMSTYYKMAYIYNEIGDQENALKTYRKLQEYSPDYAEIHYNLGILHDSIAQKMNDQIQAENHRADALREFEISVRLSNNESIKQIYTQKLKEYKTRKGEQKFLD